MVEAKKCPYCDTMLLQRPYWRHIEQQHPKEYNSDKETWIRLYNDYTGMGMNEFTTLTVIAEIFNKDPEIVKAFLEEHGIIKPE